MILLLKNNSKKQHYKKNLFYKSLNIIYIQLLKQLYILHLSKA
jgi:hypothetical protein